MASDENFSNLSKLLTCQQAQLGEFDLFQTFDDTAIYTHKVRMRDMLFAGADLKAPGVITEFRASQQIGSSHIVKVAKDSCFIDGVPS